MLGLSLSSSSRSYSRISQKRLCNPQIRLERTISYRSFSTAAAANWSSNSEEHQEHQNEESLHQGSKPSSKTERDSRLDALRRKLKQESPILSDYSYPPTQRNSEVTTQSKVNVVNTTTNNNNTTKPSMIEVLKTLPPLPSSDLILTDTFQRKHTYLRISLTERCNLRCQYCMPAEGIAQLQPDSKLLQRHEIRHLASLFVKNGVDKIRLTGGEPLLRKDLVPIVSDLASLPGLSQIGMTTNGIVLTKHLDALIAAGLTHVNISLDTLRPDRFTSLTRRSGLSHVLQSIEAAMQAFSSTYSSSTEGRVKLNCVVIRGTNDDELLDFARLTLKWPVDVRFIEWMPFFDNGWSLKNGLVPYQEMLQTLQSQVSLKRVVDGPNDTTKWWKLDEASVSTPPLGRIGFITSMSNHFCGTCNRLRLTADGQMKVCLFGSQEVSLRDILRHPDTKDADLERWMHYALQGKHYALGGHETAQGIATAVSQNRPMILIGG